jgi:ATP-dependent protease Clp ATPase subunit
LKRTATGDSLRCSFCHKSQDDVGKLISSPSDYPRAYICDECIAVCYSILQDDKPDQVEGSVPNEDPAREFQRIRNELHLLLEQIPISEVAHARTMLLTLIPPR